MSGLKVWVTWVNFCIVKNTHQQYSSTTYSILWLSLEYTETTIIVNWHVMCQLNGSQTMKFLFWLLGSVTGSHASVSVTSLSLCWEFIKEVSHGLKRFYDPDLNSRIWGKLGLEVSHGLRRFYEPDFIVDTNNWGCQWNIILEVSHGLERFYEPDLCRHVHQDRDTVGLEVSHGLKCFYEPDFIVDKVQMRTWVSLSSRSVMGSNISMNLTSVDMHIACIYTRLKSIIVSQ